MGEADFNTAARCFHDVRAAGRCGALVTPKDRPFDPRAVVGKTTACMQWDVLSRNAHNAAEIPTAFCVAKTAALRSLCLFWRSCR